MTAQMPEVVLNLHPVLDLGDLALYGIVRGDITANHGWGDGPYEYRHQPSLVDRRFTCSALWRGYVATFHIDSSGRVTLIRYEYPFRQDLPEGSRTENVGEELLGDFWLVLKERFFGPRVYVPVRDGRVVPERSQWVQEPDRGPSIFEDV